MYPIYSNNFPQCWSWQDTRYLEIGIHPPNSTSSCRVPRWPLTQLWKRCFSPGSAEAHSGRAGHFGWENYDQLFFSGHTIFERTLNVKYMDGSLWFFKSGGALNPPFDDLFSGEQSFWMVLEDTVMQFIFEYYDILCVFQGPKYVEPQVS